MSSYMAWCMTNVCPTGDQPCAPGSCSAKPNLRKLLKQLSDASHSMPRPAEATHIGHGESDSGAEAQAVHITTGDEVQDVSPASGSTTHSSEVICSSRSGADSPVSCHSATTSVLSPATPAATQTNIAAVLLDSFENSEQPAATCQASDSPATSNDGWSQSPSASDSASNAFDVDSGVSEAIQDCSDLIAQIKGKLSQPKQTTSSWQGVTVRCMASALALSAGVAAACTYWGLHEYAINWFPT